VSIELRTFPGLERVAGLVHGLTTRAGGVSAGAFASLNLGRATGDLDEHVAENGRRVAAALGVSRVRWPRQVHGTTVRFVSGADTGPVGDADVVATDEAGLGLGVLGADCPGVLLVDPARRAIAAVHSGWRGTVAGVVPAAVAALSSRYGTNPADLRAAIGPGISARRYEVGPEVADTVRTRVPHGDRCIARGRGDRSFVDLTLAIRNQLEACGVRASSIEASLLCTFDDADVLFSHRRDGAGTGRHGLVVAWSRPSV